jgi:uncharacterized membrane protein YgcG
VTVDGIDLTLSLITGTPPEVSSGSPSSEGAGVGGGVDDAATAAALLQGGGQQDAAALAAAGSSAAAAGPIVRLGAAERVAEQFVERRIKPALRRAQEKDVLEVLADSGQYLRGLWARLNGAASLGAPASAARDLLPPGLPMPISTRKDVDDTVAELRLDLEALERRLVEASKAREARLRRGGAGGAGAAGGAAGRVALAAQLRPLDAEVEAVSRALAVRTLQIELEYVYATLEDEALDIASGDLLALSVRAQGGRAADKKKKKEQRLQKKRKEGATALDADDDLDDESDVDAAAAIAGPIAREGSTSELALLAAEFRLMSEQLCVLSASEAAAAPAAGGGVVAAPPEGAAAAPAAPAAAAAPAAQATGAGASPSPTTMSPALTLLGSPAEDAAAVSPSSSPSAAASAPSAASLLEALAAEIPDMRARVGVPDAEVYGASPLNPARLRLQARESVGKVLEGVGFLLRGLRLLGTDTATAGRLFVKAALGGVLRPREVSALRRTARDLLTFVPFAIILIIPLTPLGHVLIFSFLQRYFPGFFPSQFTPRRQEIMGRYEELQRQLAEAQAAAEAVEEEAELARAAAAVARLGRLGEGGGPGEGEGEGAADKKRGGGGRGGGGEGGDGGGSGSGGGGGAGGGGSSSSSSRAQPTPRTASASAVVASPPAASSSAVATATAAAAAAPASASSASSCPSAAAAAVAPPPAATALVSAASAEAAAAAARVRHLQAAVEQARVAASGADTSMEETMDEEASASAVPTQ